MSTGPTSPLQIPYLPSERCLILKELQPLPISEFEKHTINLFSGHLLREIFSAHLDARNQACGFVMSSKKDSPEWFRALGILQRENQIHAHHCISL